MYLIVAIIQPSRLEAVQEALKETTIPRLTVSDVQGFGRQKGHTEIYRGHEYTVQLLRKIKVEIAVPDELVETTIAIIVKAARSGTNGSLGDGKVFILPMAECVRIRTGERGEEAL